MTTHHLKIDTAYVDHLLSGAKTFEVRRNDRAYQVGDYLHMKEDGNTGIEDGHWREPDATLPNRCSRCRERRYISTRVTYVYAGDPRWNDLQHGYVVLGLDECFLLPAGDVS